MKAPRAYELLVAAGAAACFADPDRGDQVEVVEIATGEVVALLGHDALSDRPPRARPGAPTRQPAPTRSSRSMVTYEDFFGEVNTVNGQRSPRASSR